MVIAVPVVVGCTLLLALGLALYMLATRAKRVGRSLLGQVLPPPAGPSTTLLITDIEVRGALHLHTDVGAK